MRLADTKERLDHRDAPCDSCRRLRSVTSVTVLRDDAEDSFELVGDAVPVHVIEVPWVGWVGVCPSFP